MALNKIRACVGYSCWLSTEDHFIWSFIGPACLIILVRSIRFLNFSSDYSVNIIIIYQLLCRCCCLFVRRVSPLKVNLLAFGVIIYKVFRHTAVKKPEISHYENIR